MAEVKSIGAVAAAGRPAHPPVPMSSGVTDAVAAQLLLADDLPDDEKPRPGDRVLLLGLVWGSSTLVELEQVAEGESLDVGRLFDLPDSDLPWKARLVQPRGSGHVLRLPQGLDGEVHGRRAVVALARGARRAASPFGGTAYELGDDERIVARVSPSLTLVARYVRATRQKDKSLLESIDRRFLAALALSVLAFGLFFVLVARSPARPAGGYLLRSPEVPARFEPRPPARVAPKAPPRELSGAREGDKSKGDEGKLGKETATRKEAAPSKKGAPDADRKARDLDRVKKLGLIAALSRVGAGGDGGADDVLGPGGLGGGIHSSLGGTRGSAAPGDAYGVGALGTRGTGSGGGGKALGIGGLGTRGTGHGGGGYGDVDLGGRGKEETVFVPGRTTVVGGLSRDVINRVIQKHYSEIKYCYEKELTKNPDLYGKVALVFVIDGSGRVGDALVQQTTMASEPVESCIVNHVRRWVFPQPQGGGTVQVTYPYVFKSSGQ